MAALSSSGSCAVLNAWLALLCLGNTDITTLSTQEVHSEEATPLLEQPPPFCQAQRGKRTPAWPLHVCHSPRREILITEANCKTNGLLCPSPLFVALHYNDYRLTSMNCTSRKRWAAMLYNIVSHKANRDTQLPNFLF